jgi:hypothetical protein
VGTATPAIFLTLGLRMGSQLRRTKRGAARPSRQSIRRNALVAMMMFHTATSLRSRELGCGAAPQRARLRTDFCPPAEESLCL